MRLLNKNKERLQCISIVYWLLLIKFSLWLLPYKNVLHKVSRWAEGFNALQTRDECSVEKICRLTDKCADAFPFRVLCLPRALTGYIQCHRYGFKVKLEFGVKRSTVDGFVAHAWLELDNIILIGDRPDIEDFSRFNFENVLK